MIQYGFIAYRDGIELPYRGMDLNRMLSLLGWKNNIIGDHCDGVVDIMSPVLVWRLLKQNGSVNITIESGDMKYSLRAETQQQK